MPPKKDDEKKEEDPMKSLLKLSVKYANSKAFQDLSDTRISAEQVVPTCKPMQIHACKKIRIYSM
jgi:hypothetical protein